MASQGPATRRRDALLVPAAMLGANLTAYLLLLVAARLLGRPDYGALVSLLGLLLVATVSALAVQTVAARHTAAAAGAPPRRAIARTTAIVTGAATITLLAAAVPLAAFLHLDRPWGPVGIALCVPGLTVLGAQQGLAQGARHFALLATLTLATVGGRAVGGLIGLALGRSAGWCVVGTVAGVSVAALACRPLTRGADDGSVAVPGLLAEVAHAAHGHAAFLVLTTIDVLLARHLLTPGIAGIYAAGSVVTRAALWLPQSVAVLTFATLTDAARHRRAYLNAVVVLLALGAAGVGVAAGLGRLIVSIVAGRRFHALDDTVWLYATVGAALAVLQLSLVAGLAMRRPARVAVVWAVAGVDVVLAETVAPASAAGLAGLLAAVTVCGAAASVMISVAGSRSRRGPATAGTAQPSLPGHGPGP